MASVVTFGDNVVDCYEDRGLMFPGGNALNVSVFANRFGASASYVGAVGDDSAGHHVRSALVSEGIDISRLRILAGGTAFCMIGNRNGEREFLTDLGVSIVAPNKGDLAHIEACTRDARPIVDTRITGLQSFACTDTSLSLHGKRLSPSAIT